MNKILFCLIFVTSVTSKVGIEKWCTLNIQDGRMECNYQTQADCEGFRFDNEYCLQNPTFNKDKKVKANVQA